MSNRYEVKADAPKVELRLKLEAAVCEINQLRTTLAQHEATIVALRATLAALRVPNAELTVRALQLSFERNCDTVVRGNTIINPKTNEVLYASE